MVGVLVVVRRIEDDLGVGLGLDVSWWDGLSHGDLQKESLELSEDYGDFDCFYTDFLSVL